MAGPHAPKRAPITRSADPVRVAWQWGYDAACDGYTDSACPWNVNSPEYAKWHEGYTEGLKAP